MIYEIPFGDEMLRAELPQQNVLYYALPVKPDDFADRHELIEAALDAPFGTARLEDMVSPGMHVLILLDDITRPTPKKLLLTHALWRLEKAGISDADIQLAFAPGTHRSLSDKEVVDLLGSDITSRFKIININYRDTDRLVDIGLSPSGIPIKVYREAVEADFKIGIGNIVPHVSAGWGGGGKIVQPGICGEVTTQGTHLMACLDQDVTETCGNAENKCRHEIELIAHRVGLQFIINTVMDEQERLCGVFCGDFIAAHRAGVKVARGILCPEIPAKADIVIASANPCHIDFWQGSKPYVYAQYGLKEGGTLIFVIDGQDGLCGNSPEHDYTVRHYSMLSEETIRKDIEEGVIEDLIGVDVPIFQDQIRKRGINILLVTRGFSPDDADCLGFEMTSGLDEAIALAFQRQGQDATVGIIPYCGETLVRCED